MARKLYQALQISKSTARLSHLFPAVIWDGFGDGIVILNGTKKFQYGICAQMISSFLSRG